MNAFRQHMPQQFLAFTMGCRQSQGKKPFQGILSTICMCGCQAAMSGKCCTQKFKGFLANNFPNAISIQGHCQTIGDKVA